MNSKHESYSYEGQYENEYDYYDECEDGYIEENNSADKDGNSVHPDQKKAKRENSRFTDHVAKRFKGKEMCDEPIDSTLVDNINELFKKSITMTGTIV